MCLNRLNQLLILLILVFQLSACVTTAVNQDGESVSDPQSVSYHLFFTPEDHMKQLLKAKQYDDAADVYTAQKDFFQKKEAKYIPLFDELAQNLNNRQQAGIKSALQILNGINEIPGPQAGWPQLGENLDNIEEVLGEYLAYEILSRPEYKLSDFVQLRSQLEDTQAKIRAATDTAFEKFDHTLEPDFFSTYPVPVDDPITYLQGKEAWLTKQFESYTPEQLEVFLINYDELLTSNEELESLYTGLSDSYIEKMKSRFKPGLKGYLKTVNLAKEKGFSPHISSGVKIAVIDGSSQSLLTAGAIEFPVELDIDFLANASKETLQKALKGDYDYILIFSVNAAKNIRRILKRNTHRSKFVSGHREDPNPEYEQVKLAAYQAQMNLASENSRFCSGWGCAAKMVLVAAAASVADEKNQILANTPMTITKPIYEKYQYSSSNVTAKKFAAAKYYFLDLREKQMYSGEFDVLEEQKFSIAYNVHEDDESHSGILKDYDSEDDIKTFEEEGISIQLSDVVDQVLKGGGKHQRLNKKYTFLKDKILADRHATIAKHNDYQEDITIEKDQRMDHVVVVFTPTGIGTGFYVKPDLILTNYHVIEGSQYVELKTNGGLESFGKVVKSDVRLDLALVKAQQRGKPIQFYKGSIPLGSTVEALGHPKGLEFSVTRGVVSALRKRKSVYDVGGKDVLFVQTDTPINPGNSGGPLFLGTRVVGVNNNKLVDVTTEGIAFSIHYKEVEQFLNREF